jgi:hypothetical protein
MIQNHGKTVNELSGKVTAQKIHVGGGARAEKRKSYMIECPHIMSE